MKSEYTDDAYLNICLRAMIGSEPLVQQWWDSPNLAFEDKTPKQVYLHSPEGQLQVTSYILGCANGDYY